MTHWYFQAMVRNTPSKRCDYLFFKFIKERAVIVFMDRTSIGIIAAFALVGIVVLSIIHYSFEEPEIEPIIVEVLPEIKEPVVVVVIPDCVDANGNEIEQESYIAKCHPLFVP